MNKVALVEVLGWAPFVVSIKVEYGGSIRSRVGRNENFRFDLLNIKIFHKRSWGHVYGLNGSVEGSLNPAFVDELVADVVDLIRSGDEFVALACRGSAGDGTPGDIVNLNDHLTEGIGGGCGRGAENGKK